VVAANPRTGVDVVDMLWSMCQKATKAMALQTRFQVFRIQSRPDFGARGVVDGGCVSRIAPT
jgi:hypothetical protein